MTKNTFLEYIENSDIGLYIHDKILKHCNSNRKMVLEHINDFGFHFVNEVNEAYLNFKSVRINGVGPSVIDFDVLLEVDLDCVGVCGKRHDHEDCSARVWFKVSCTSDLKKKFKDFVINSIAEYDGNKTKLDSPLTGDFIPFMDKSNFDSYANDILEKFYPEALATPMPIDVDLLANRMGLTIVPVKITDDSSIFGQFFFADSDTDIFDSDNNKRSIKVNANTILIDDQVNFLYSFGSRNMTVVHECVHSYFHYKAFLFSQILDGSLKNIRCKTHGGIDANTTSTLARIEMQANALAPYILMPVEMFQKMAFQLIEDYGRLFGGNVIDLLPYVIDELSSIFKVTRYAARKRLIDIGIIEAIGVLNWVDGSYIRPYAFNKDSLKANETFTISVNDLSLELLLKQELISYLNTCGFLFVENHLILNDARYVFKNNKGVLLLTDYARLHIDECAVKFAVRYKNDSLPLDLDMMCYLCRDRSKLVEYDLTLQKNTALIMTEEGQKKHKLHEKNVNSVISKISGVQFGEALTILMEFLDIDEQSLSEDADVSIKTISRYRSDYDKEKDKRTVVAIIRGLNVPPKIAWILLASAGITLVPGNELDDSLSSVLTFFREHPAEKVNEFLTKRTGKPLTRDKL